MKKGLNRTLIVQTAVEMIAEKGLEAFSLRELAACLAVKPASLYNHVENIDDLYTAVGALVMGQLRDVLVQATAGKEGDSAVRALAEAYYRYGKENPELYKTIIAMRNREGEALKGPFKETLAPFYEALRAYHLPEMEVVAMHRMLRGLIHGYLMLEEAGYFTRPLVSPAASYEMAVESVIDGLHVAATRTKGGVAVEHAE